MKKIILISVLLNLGLIVVLGYMLKITPAAKTTDVAAAPATPMTEKSPNEAKVESAPAEKSARIKIAADKFTWRKLEPEEYKKYIAHLRAIHCPDATIGVIIVADVNRFYAAKLAPFRKPKERKAFQFWKTGHNFYSTPRESDEYYKMESQLEKEKMAWLRELLGDDRTEIVRARYGFGGSTDKSDPLEKLPKEKKDQLEEIDRRYNDAKQAFYRKIKGDQDEDDQAELAKMKKHWRDELDKVLTPEELFEREVRSSDLADNLRSNDLRAFEPTEDEFRAIFKAKQAAEFAQLNSPSTNTDRSFWELRQKTQKQIEADLKDALGADRMKEYNLAQDYEYSSVVEIAEEQGLPRETAKEVYDMKAEVVRAARDVREDRSLTADQRNEKLKLVKEETEKTVTELLGPKGFKSYKRNADWLRDLIPQQGN